MAKIIKLIIFILLVADVLVIVWLLLYGKNIAILNPMGYMAHRERDLILTSILLLLGIVVPALTTLLIVVLKYRAGNTKAFYAPEWNHSTWWQAALWAFPSSIILILMIINWNVAHQLDPHQPLPSNKKPLTVEVVALRWKWLFIYPEQNIATINYLVFPEQTPITFKLTADAPINSFWIPNLGGQMYAMAGMVTPLHLMADGVGTYTGSTAEMSGPGFAGMRFTAKSVTDTEFTSWVDTVKQSSQKLSFDDYRLLAKPTEDTPPAFYSSTEENLFNKIIMQFMPPSSTDSQPKGVAYPNGTTGQVLQGMNR